MITIRQPLCFSEIGRKDNQEDFLYPQHADTATRVFIMCDGMGGHDNGEVASRTAATALGEYLSSCRKVDLDVFDTGLSLAYDALDGIDTNSAKKPGTTMTCLCLNDDSYLVAHIGDSRIYHIRPSLFNKSTKRGGILYQSSDHSLVNDLLKAGELTEKEAHLFPHKNVITRAMQPHLDKRYSADEYVFDDIEAGDYFFLCCDGVLEQLSNEDLCEILANDSLNDKQKLTAIKSICDGKTRDNYTCWLIPIDEVEIARKSENSMIIQASSEENEDTEADLEDTAGNILPKDSSNASSSSHPKTVKDNLKGLLKQMAGISTGSAKKKWLTWIFIVVALGIVVWGGIFAFNTFFASNKETPIQKTHPKTVGKKDVKKENIPADRHGKNTIKPLKVIKTASQSKGASDSLATSLQSKVKSDTPKK